MATKGPVLTSVPGGKSPELYRLEKLEESVDRLVNRDDTKGAPMPQYSSTIKDGIIIGLVILIGTIAFYQTQDAETRMEKRLDDWVQQMQKESAEFRQQLRDDRAEARIEHQRFMERMDRAEDRLYNQKSTPTP